MKKILIILLLISTGIFAQSDTIVQDTTDIEYDCSILKLITDIDNDTISSSYLVYNETRLEWFNNPSTHRVVWEDICDSVIDIFRIDFETILSSSRIQSYSDTSGIYTLTRVTCSYSDLSISEGHVEYYKNEKAPNGILLNNSVQVPTIILTEEQIIPFTEFSQQPEIRALYLDVYGKNIGNK